MHEPKGITTATNNQVYVANGSNSGSWTNLPLAIHATIADVSTAETVYIPIPYACIVSRITTVLEGAITVADATITAKNAAGSSMGTITVAYTSSAAGDVDSLDSASNNTISDNSFLTIETNGGSTDAQRLFVTVYVELT